MAKLCLATFVSPPLGSAGDFESEGRPNLRSSPPPPIRSFSSLSPPASPAWLSSFGKASSSPAAQKQDFLKTTKNRHKTFYRNFPALRRTPPPASPSPEAASESCDTTDSCKKNWNFLLLIVSTLTTWGTSSPLPLAPTSSTCRGTSSRSAPGRAAATAPPSPPRPWGGRSLQSPRC